MNGSDHNHFCLMFKSAHYVYKFKINLELDWSKFILKLINQIKQMQRMNEVGELYYDFLTTINEAMQTDFIKIKSLEE